MTQPPQGYPQQQYSAPPQPAPPQPAPRGPASPRWTPGLLAMLAFLIAAAATVWGTFSSIEKYRNKSAADGSGGSREFGYDVTWWAIDRLGPSGPATTEDWFPPYGVLPAIGAGLLVIAAVLAVTAFAGRRAGLVTGTRVTAAAGIGLLAGMTALRLLDSLQTLDQVNKQPLDPGEASEFEIGLGIYLPGGAAVLGILGLLLTLNRGRAGRVEPDTPRMGFAMPYQPQYQPPQQQPYPQQPYQQQPASQPFPVQQPVAQPVAPAQPAERPEAPQPQPDPPRPPD